MAWRKVECEKGIPFYINEACGTKQWDHPDFANVITAIQKCDSIKYSVYRLASKFRILQKALHLDEIQLSVVCGVFEKHSLKSTESSLNLETYDLEAILSDVFFAAKKLSRSGFDVETATDLFLNFLYNVFDSKRSGKIQVFPVKLTLGLLSASSIGELHDFLYEECSDYNRCVTRLRLASFLSTVAKMAQFVQEETWTGAGLISAAVEDCFLGCPGHVGINEDIFRAWLRTGPPLLSWMTTLHRLRRSEQTVHLVRCGICSKNPIHGLRFRCLRCARLDLCQGCFLTGQHKRSHPAREHCVARSSPAVGAWLKRLASCLVQPEAFEDRPWAPRELLCSSREKLLGVEEAAVPQAPPTPDSSSKELHKVVSELEQQVRELKTLGSGSAGDIRQRINLIKDQLGIQIHRLETLDVWLQTVGPPSHHQPHSPANQAEESGYTVATPSLRQGDATASPLYTMQDLSTWIAGPSSPSLVADETTNPDLDAMLDQLQRILANNLTDSVQEVLN